MRRAFLFMTGVLIVMACIPASPGHVSAAPPHAGKLLYTWKFPARGHIGAWALDKHVGSYLGNSVGAIFAPYTVHTSNFAIEARLRTDGSAGYDVNYPAFGLVVRTKLSDPHTSVNAGSYFSGNGEDDGPEIAWNGQTVGGQAFDPKTSWHLYRLEVAGDQYRLLIDGKPVVQYTIDDYPHPTRVGVFSSFYTAHVRDFKVYALSASSTPVSAAPEARRFNLTITDLPTSGFYDPYVQHWLRNAELARIRGVSEQSLQQSGRIVGHEIDFYARDPQVSDVYSAVTAFTSPAGAVGEMASRLATFRSTYIGTPDYTEGREIPSVGIGDASGGISFAFTQSLLGYSFKTRVVLLYVVQGRYTDFLRLSFDGDTSYDDAVAYTVRLARIVDARIQAG